MKAVRQNRVDTAWIHSYKYLENANQYTVIESNQWFPGQEMGREGLKKGRKLLGVMGVFIVLNVVMVS